MKKTVIVALCLALSSFALVGCSGKSEPFEEKIIRRIYRSAGSILLCGIEKLKCLCPRTNKFTFNILKTIRNLMISLFRRKMC